MNPPSRTWWISMGFGVFFLLLTFLFGFMHEYVSMWLFAVVSAAAVSFARVMR